MPLDTYTVSHGVKIVSNSGSDATIFAGSSTDLATLAVTAQSSSIGSLFLRDDGVFLKKNADTDQLSDWVILNETGYVASTGVSDGGIITTGTSTNQYSIGSGNGIIVNELGDITDVSWTDKIDITPTNIATNTITYVGLDSNGGVVEQTTPFTPTQYRTIISLGMLIHNDLTDINTISNEQHVTFNTMSSVYDGFKSLGFFNVMGNVFGANGANLSIDKTAGSIFKMGSNYDTDINNPHQRTLLALTGPTFRYQFNDGTLGPEVTSIDPDNLDDGSGGLVGISNNRWSVQRIYSFASNIVKIQRGVAEFTTLDSAVNGIPTEGYITEESIEVDGLLRGWLVIKEGTTDLSDTGDALFLSAPKFGSSGGSAGGATITDLQTAYSNSVPTSEIVTTAVNGSLSIKEGTGDDLGFILEGKNNADVVTSSINGDGDIVAKSVNLGGNSTQILKADGSVEYGYYDFLINVEYTSVENTIASGVVLTCDFQGGTIYRFINSTENANGYPIEDSFYSDFDGTNLTNLIISRG
jgi:hypothetical protein